MVESPESTGASSRDGLVGGGRDARDHVQTDTVRAITAIARRFAGAVVDLDHAIDETLAEIGALAGADRAYLFLMRDGGRVMDNTHEWCADGVEPQRDTLQGLPSDSIPWWMERLAHGDHLRIDDVASMPPEAGPEREILERQGIRALAVVPLRLDGRLAGFVGLDLVRAPQPWFPDTPAVLAMVAEVVAHALERRRHEAEAERLRGELREAQRLEAVGRLAGGIAHDFNNQLTAVINFVALARDSLTDEPQVRADLDASLQAAGKARALTQRLLVFARQRGGVPLTVNVSEALRAITPLLAHAVGPVAQLEHDLAADMPVVDVDPAFLDQIVLNLVLNARDALGGAGGTIRVVGRRTPEGWCRIEVRDNGVGMSPTVVERAFEPYFTTKSPPEGAGLGLSSVHGIVKRMGGRVRLESTPGAGTVAIVELPPAEEAVVETAPPVPRKRGEGRTALLIEDDPLVRAVVRRILMGAGYAVTDLSEPKAALAEAETLAVAPSVVLTDVSLPGMAGPELARRLRQVWPAVPVVMISGHGDGALAQLGLDPSEIPMVLPKPFTAATLLGRLDELFASQPSDHADADRHE